jgi:hypothetical protein
MMVSAQASVAERPDCIASFDHLVGALLELERNVDADCLCGLEVDHQFELDRGLDGKLAPKMRAIRTFIVRSCAKCFSGNVPAISTSDRFANRCGF